jgi:uncharacterized protein (DUF1684 family)
MKSLIVCFTFFYIVTISFSQSYTQDIEQAREIKLHELLDSNSHILTAAEKELFNALDYFPIDTNYRLQGTFKKDLGKRFKMATSTDRTPIYRRYGYVEFSINEQQFQLTVFQNIALKKQKEFKDYLFIPFRDATNRLTTYGGGRYLDLKKPKDKLIILDFNTAYNPYCTYSHRYSCPIPPVENKVEIAIPSGEKTPLIRESN